MKYRIIAARLGGVHTRYVIQQFIEGNDWAVPARLWYSPNCGYFKTFEEAKLRLDEMLNPSQPEEPVVLYQTNG